MKMIPPMLDNTVQGNDPEGNLRESPLMTLTVPQMMKELHISKNMAYDLTKRPGFPCFHLGKRILINRELLQEWLNRQCGASLAAE